MFKALFQVSWKFNLAIKTMSNTWLEPNYRIALIELEQRMQNHIYCIFVSTLQTHAKCFHFRALCVNNLELDNFHNKREGSFFLKLFEFYFYLFFFFFVLTLSENYFPVWDIISKLFSQENLNKVLNIVRRVN